MVEHLKISIRGRVQGVGFRYQAKKEAEKLGIRGSVQNLPNGDVLIYAEGSPPDLQKFLKWCYLGPPEARVTNVEYFKDEAKNYTGFEITT